MQLNVIYEDNDILVCFKPTGVATQTAKLFGQDMVSLIKNYLAKKENIKNPYVGVIHRLDQPVSGLLVFAKNQKAAGVLSKQIQEGNANKDYIACCTGILEEKSGVLTHYIMKDSKTKLAGIISEEQYMQMKESNKDERITLYKKAVLSYEVIETNGNSSIIKVHLQTGRYHQIRAQFSFIGHSLLGDVKYGTEESKKLSVKKGIRNVALCANSLSFSHPTNGKKINFVLSKEQIPIEMRTKDNES